MIHAPKGANQCDHVAGNFQSSDRTGGWFGLCILQKHPGTLRNNQTAARPPLSGNFAKKAPNFSQNQSKVQQSRFKEICKENLKFVKSTRRPDPLSEFLKKILKF